MQLQKCSDRAAPHFPVSVKSVIYLDDKIILLKNERDEWELPGGKLDPGESPESCVVREVFEELSISVQIDRIIDSWLYVGVDTEFGKNSTLRFFYLL
ncbi:MAG: NUDIX domain-containing protein [Alphaproteobacteria bacterium]|nr:NUDIX domain-containing protein [Alphaproteobacteria bacterium]